MSVGRSVLPILEGVKTNHVISWIGDTTTELVESAHSKNVNWTQHGITAASLHNHHVIAILESHSTSGETLTDMLQKSKLVQEEQEFGPNRVRLKEPIEIPTIADEDNVSNSSSSRRLSDFDISSITEDRTLFLRSEQTLTESIEHRLRYPLSDPFDAEPEHNDEHSFHLLSNAAFPVDRATRPVNKTELVDKYDEIRAARKKELLSWVENNTGSAQPRSTWEASSGRRAIPCRWVDTWKYKQGELIAKSRLCLKGFAEPLSPDETNSSPTANRVSHRLVCATSAQRNWVLSSLDVSVAFLKGLTFSQLAEKGIAHKPVAFVPCEDV